MKGLGIFSIIVLAILPVIMILFPVSVDINKGINWIIFTLIFTTLPIIVLFLRFEETKIQKLLPWSGF